MKTYTIYMASEKIEVEIKEKSKISELRKAIEGKISKSISGYRFIRRLRGDEDEPYNVFVVKKKDEEKRKLGSSFMFDNGIQLVAIKGADSTAILGTYKDKIESRNNLTVKVNLNLPWMEKQRDKTKEEIELFRSENPAWQANRRADGTRKLEPFVLQDIEITNKEFNKFGPEYAIICEEGSAIRFDLEEWGAAGYGFRIKSTKETVVNKLCRAFKSSDTDSIGRVSVCAYDTDNQGIIKVVNLPKGYSSKDILDYNKYTIVTWNVSSVVWKNGEKNESKTPYPSTKLKAHETEKDTVVTDATAGKTEEGKNDGNLERTLKSIKHDFDSDANEPTRISSRVSFVIFVVKKEAAERIKAINTLQEFKDY